MEEIFEPAQSLSLFVEIPGFDVRRKKFKIFFELTVALNYLQAKICLLEI